MICKEINSKIKDLFSEYAENCIFNYGKKLDLAVVFNENEHGLWAVIKDRPTGLLEMLTELIFTVKKLYETEINAPKVVACIDTDFIYFFDFMGFLVYYRQGVVDWNTKPYDTKSEGFLKLKAILQAENPKYEKYSLSNKCIVKNKLSTIFKAENMCISGENCSISLERKGAFFTPQRWVLKAHEAISNVFGEDWQEKYYVWDCACGTGNLLQGLINSEKIYGSTLDKSDVQIARGLLKNNKIFQFDFLNDSFEKLPEKLREIIEKTPENLIILINPPYSDSSANILKTSGGRAGTNDTVIKSRYFNELGRARNELCSQFLMRIYKEISGCKIAEFSKMSVLQSPNYAVMRRNFQPKLLSCFLVPGNSFDNVKGNFPIGFKIWDTGEKAVFTSIQAEVYDIKGNKEVEISSKIIHSYDKGELINSWDISGNSAEIIGELTFTSNDFQQQGLTQISNDFTLAKRSHFAKVGVSLDNIIKVAIYLAVRWAIKATWLNDRDQFLKPNTENFSEDFENDCLIYTLFAGHNHISIKLGANHWIPFSKSECGYEGKFEFNTLYQYLQERNIPENLSENARKVYDYGLEIFKYYHGIWGLEHKENYNENAAFYDIRACLQGRNSKGKMNVKSEDTTYQKLIESLRGKMECLRKESIAPKVYEYGFLK